MTPDRARRIFQDIIGSETEFGLFCDRFQSEPLLLPGTSHNRWARMVLGENAAEALRKAEPVLRQDVKFYSASAPEEAAAKSRLDPNCKDGFVAACIEQGFTARFIQADKAIERLALIRRAIELLFPEKETTIVVWWSPGGIQGAPLHFDAAEVLTLQLSGTKTWWVERAPVKHPNPWWSTRLHAETEEGEYDTYVLNEGDLLYVPAGHLHRALAGTEGSIHATIVFRTITVRDAINALLDYVADNNVDLRLPAFSLTDPRAQAWEIDTSDRLWEDAPNRLMSQIGALQKLINADREIVHRALLAYRAEYIRKLPPLPLPGSAEEISSDTPIRLRELAIGEVVVSDEAAALYYPSGRIRGPRQMEAAFRYALTHDWFTPDDLPGPLSPKAKVGLVEQMIRYRIAEVAEPRPH